MIGSEIKFTPVTRGLCLRSKFFRRGLEANVNSGEHEIKSGYNRIMVTPSFSYPTTWGTRVYVSDDGTIKLEIEVW